MAGSLNKVLLIGRLGADPEIKQMVNGKSVARLSLAGSQIRLGINAPKDVKVHREEIYEKINVDTSETATK